MGQVPGGSKGGKEGLENLDGQPAEQPEEEWLQTSSEEEQNDVAGDNAQFDLSQEISI